MSISITLKQSLVLRDKGAVFIDVRSPSEFSEATIPGAVNVPLLDDAERAEVGTLYKNSGKQTARRRGVELVSPKIPSLVDQVAPLQEKTCLPAIVFCWRGGMRSLALTQFLELAGVPARQLERGHKGFRRHVLTYFEKADWGRMIVLRGLTGVGKTQYLHKLKQCGHPVIDLERLANHRGSAFGNVGLPEQPGQKMFEALVWDELRRIPAGGYVLAEGESRHIGRVALPVEVYKSLQVETSVWLDAPMSMRVKNILHDYPAIDSMKADFSAPVKALKDRLGRKKVAEYLMMLEVGDWEMLVADLMENYYDPLYQHTLPERRVEVSLTPQETALERINAAVQDVLSENK